MNISLENTSIAFVMIIVPLAVKLYPFLSRGLEIVLFKGLINGKITGTVPRAIRGRLTDRTDHWDFLHRDQPRSDSLANHKCPYGIPLRSI